MYLKRAPKARAKNLGFYRGTVYDVTSFKFHGSRYSAPAPFPADAHRHGRPQKIFQSGAKPTTPKKVYGFPVRRSRKRKICALLRHFRLYMEGFLLRAQKARAKMFGYFTGGQHMTSFFSNSMEVVGKCPPPTCGRPCP